MKYIKFQRKDSRQAGMTEVSLFPWFLSFDFDTVVLLIQ